VGAGLDQAGTLWIETLDGQRAGIRPGSEGELVTAHQEENVTVETDFNQQLTMRVGPRLERTFEFVTANRSVSLKPLLLYEDKQANLWIGTQEAGLYRLQRQSIRSYSKEEGLVDRDTYASMKTARQLYGSAPGTRVTRYAEGKYQNFNMADGLPNGLATALFQDREGTFWVGDARRINAVRKRPLSARGQA
jgi:ligand-binding sensor domain-containing protein